MVKKKTKKTLTAILTFLVSLAVGFGIAQGVLSVPWIGAFALGGITINQVVGYITMIMATVVIVKGFK